MKNKYNVGGIAYVKPVVILLNDTGIGSAEFAARSCYDSFDKSENEIVREAENQLCLGISQDLYNEVYKEELNEISHSNLLDDLSWTYFHGSILEHAMLTYLIKGTSRGVLQEHARHRIQAISVRSTRYTMGSILNAFNAASKFRSARDRFIEKVLSFNMFVTDDNTYNMIEIGTMYDKLSYQRGIVGDRKFIEMSTSKSSIELFDKNILFEEMFKMLEAGKAKRNVGDAFKHIITDNVKVDMVVSFNLRSLKNYIDLRVSGSAYFQIQWLGEEMMKATPRKYLDLIVKQDKINKITRLEK